MSITVKHKGDNGNHIPYTEYQFIYDDGRNVETIKAYALSIGEAKHMVVNAVCSKYDIDEPIARSRLRQVAGF